MDEPLLSFHWPAYKGTDLFHERGGTGGRSLKGCFFLPERAGLASCCSLRVRHLERCEKKERADPRAALTAARRNSPGLSGATSVSGMMGAGLSAVAWVRDQHPSCRSQDRKSTRLNSSHANISYSVFCFKKKKPRAPHR